MLVVVALFFFDHCAATSSVTKAAAYLGSRCSSRVSNHFCEGEDNWLLLAAQHTLDEERWQRSLGRPILGSSPAVSLPLQSDVKSPVMIECQKMCLIKAVSASRDP